jgi:protein O-mannosyl-transferase
MNRKSSRPRKPAKSDDNHTKTTQRANIEANTINYSRIAVTAFLFGSVLIIVSATHWPVLSANALSFDDGEYLTENALVKNPSLNSARRFLCEILEPSTVSGYYQPLAMISLMLDYARSGSADNLRAFHETSLLLHLLNTALVMLLIFGLFGRVWVAAATGLLFGLHPMTVETIAWVGERKTVLAAFFALLSLNFYVRYARKGGWNFYCLTILTYILALMSKPTSTPLPILMLVLDYWPLRRLSKAAVMEKLPMLLIGVISGIVTIISQSGTAFVRLPGQYPPTVIPLMVCYSLMFYLSKIFYPVHLSSHYPFPVSLSLSEPMIVTAIICMIILIVAAVISVRWTRAFLAGLFFFFIGILPAMQIIGFSDVIASDKFAYIPAVGLLISGGYLLMRLWDWAAGKKLIRLYRIGIAAVILLAVEREIAGTRNYLVHWRNTEDLCLYMISMSPKAPTLYDHLGFFYYNSGDTDKAVDEWSKALVINPDYDPVLNNLAWVLATNENTEKRNIRKAVQLAERSCQLTGYKNAVKLVTLATAYLQMGELEKSAAVLQKAAALKPKYAVAHECLADVLLKQYNLDEAVTHYRKAIKLKPDWADPMNNLAVIIATVPQIKNRDVNEAISLANRACELTSHKNAAFLGTLAAAYASAGRFSDAVNTAKTAINLADAAHQSQVKKIIEYHLTFYSDGKPYIETLPMPPSDSNKP